MTQECMSVLSSSLRPGLPQSHYHAPLQIILRRPLPRENDVVSQGRIFVFVYIRIHGLPLHSRQLCDVRIDPSDGWEPCRKDTQSPGSLGHRSLWPPAAPVPHPRPCRGHGSPRRRENLRFCGRSLMRCVVVDAESLASFKPPFDSPTSIGWVGRATSCHCRCEINLPN